MFSINHMFLCLIYSSQTIAYTVTDSKVASVITIGEGKDKKQYIKVTIYF